MLKKILYSLILVASVNFSLAQGDKDNNVDYLGFGFSNLGGFGVSKIAADTSYTPQFFIEYHEMLDSNLYARFGISTNFSTEKLGTIRYYALIPFNLFVGLEKSITKGKIKFNYGADLFFSLSARGSQLGNGTWRGDDFGGGITILGGIDYTLNEIWSIGTEISSGVGLYRGFQNVGTTTAPSIFPKVTFLKSLSIGLKRVIRPKK